MLGPAGKGRLASLLAMARRFRARFPSAAFSLVKSDFKSAYRCVPVLVDHLAFARVRVSDPASGSLYLSVQWAMPFGAIGAVYALSLIHI